MQFNIIGTDSNARACLFETQRGQVNTPAFLPVGTLGTVKAMAPEELKDMGTEMILCNNQRINTLSVVEIKMNKL